jgi:hypothetical protein
MRRRILLVIFLGWAPLAALSFASGSLFSFLADIGVNTRFLIGAPLLIAAESWCLPRLSKISYHFLNSGIVTGDDRARIHSAFASTNRLLNSIWAEVLAVPLAYAAVGGLTLLVPLPELPSWHVYSGQAGLAHTMAGRWHLLISLPLLLLLLIGWAWRHLVWCSLLWSISKLRLSLVATHPDRAGGLGFLGSTLRGYWPLCFAVAAITAARVGNNVLEGSSPYEFRYFIAGILTFVLVVYLAPFIVFIPALRALRERGHFKYGVLGLMVGRQFEYKWLKEDAAESDSTLSQPDFSATTDLYSVIGIAHEVRYFPIALRPVKELVIATLLPFVPVMLLTIPFDVVMDHIAKLLL